jgi:hypothetical protein
MGRRRGEAGQRRTRSRAPSDPRASAAESSLPGVDGVDLAALAREYSAAVARVLDAPLWKLLAADVVGLFALGYLAYGVVAGRLAAVAHASPPSATLAALALYLVTVLVSGGFFYLMGAVIRVAPDSVDLTAPPRRPRYVTAQVSTVSLDRRGRHGTAVIAIALSVVVVACLALANPGLDVVVAAARASSFLVTIACALGIWEWGQVVGHGLAARLAGAVGRPRPLDRVATQLVVIAARVWALAGASGAVDQASVRMQVDALERAARDAQRFALARAPRWDGDARRAARRDGWRVAVVIRAHKAPLARAVGAEDFAAVARSLTGGLAAWSREDFASMVGGAPATTPPGRSRAVVARLLPAVTMAVLAVVLPLLPPLNATAQAASSARVSLLVGAVLALVTGAVQVEDWASTAVLRK